MVIDGTGNINATDYGSLGSYNITGISGVLPIRSVKLTGNVVANKHKLNWQVVAEEALQSFTVQVSDDGHYFYNISSLDKTTSNFINSPIQSNTIYYRIQVLFADGLTAFSNIISIGGNNKSGHAFTVSTMVSNEISVQAASQYQYVLSDINGNVLSKGNGKSGFSKINSSSFAGGIYLLQLIGENAKQTERIIKL
jgi:hypothetical protein